MALNDYETSADRGEPVELYKITYGDGATLTYTDAEAEITHDSITYTPHPIMREKIESNGRLDDNELTVEVPISSPLADLFRTFPPARVVNIEIRQGHVPDPSNPSSWDLGENFPVAFSGRILEARRAGIRCTLTCELIGASMKRPGLRRHYQWPCPLALYGSRCGADISAASAAVTVSAVNGNSVTLSAGFPASGRTGKDYIGGLFRWTGDNGLEQLTILRVNGLTLTLSGPVRFLSPGESATAILGCPHTLQGCTDLHNNAVNYGGHPFIPTGTNPIGKNNHT